MPNDNNPRWEYVYGENDGIRGLKECVDIVRSSKYVRQNMVGGVLSVEQVSILLFVIYVGECTVFSMRLGVDNDCTHEDVEYLYNMEFIEWIEHDRPFDSSIAPKLKASPKGLSFFNDIFLH